MATRMVVTFFSLMLLGPWAQAGVIPAPTCVQNDALMNCAYKLHLKKCEAIVKKQYASFQCDMVTNADAIAKVKGCLSLQNQRDCEVPGVSEATTCPQETLNAQGPATVNCATPPAPPPQVIILKQESGDIKEAAQPAPPPDPLRQAPAKVETPPPEQPLDPPEPKNTDRADRGDRGDRIERGDRAEREDRLDSGGGFNPLMAGMLGFGGGMMFSRLFGGNNYGSYRSPYGAYGPYGPMGPMGMMGGPMGGFRPGFGGPGFGGPGFGGPGFGGSPFGFNSNIYNGGNYGLGFGNGGVGAPGIVPLGGVGTIGGGFGGGFGGGAPAFAPYIQNTYPGTNGGFSNMYSPSFH